MSTSQLAVTVLIWVCVIAGSVLLARKTGLPDIRAYNETKFAAAELLLVLIWSFAVFYYVKSTGMRPGLIFIVIYVSLWLHRIAVPAAAAGMYIAYLVLLGDCVNDVLSGIGRRTGTRGRRGSTGARRLLRGFVSGASVQILLSAVMSVFGAATPSGLRIQVLVTAAACGIFFWCRNFGEGGMNMPSLPPEDELKAEHDARLWISLCGALIITMLLL